MILLPFLIAIIVGTVKDLLKILNGYRWTDDIEWFEFRPYNEIWNEIFPVLPRESVYGPVYTASDWEKVILDKGDTIK